MKRKSKSVHLKTLSLFWHFTRQHPVYFWSATIGSVLATIAADILPPLIIAAAFNKLQYLYSNKQDITFEVMMPYFAMYCAAALAAVVLWRTQAKLAWTYMIYAQQLIMQRIFEHLQLMDNRFHSNTFGGSLVSQANKFAGAYDRILADFNWNILNGITSFVVSLTILLFINPIYALAFIVACSGYFVVIYKRMRSQLPYNRALATSESLTTAKLADMITNVGTVKAFAGEEAERQLFQKQTISTRNAYKRLMNVQMRNELFSQTGTSAIEILAFGIGLYTVIVLNQPIGALYLTLTYTLNLTNKLWHFMFILKNINRSFGDAADMTEILSTSPEVSDPEIPEAARIKRGSIEFNNVTFQHSEAQSPLFSGLNIRIKQGEKIGLVGPSGGGKTTLTKLLMRFTDLQDGEILIDGQNITHIRQRELRRHISYVPQDPMLFHRSLRDNISYSAPEASDKTVEAIARMAHADEFIDELPKRYETLVGERGVKLSGGQRQRIAIARAMLKNAPILVLDEATSALDSESEVLIQDALWKLMERRTAIVVAHRLSTIQKMDRIIVLENGSIAEQGSHKELLQRDGTYAKLWAHQSGGFIED